MTLCAGRMPVGKTAKKRSQLNQSSSMPVEATQSVHDVTVRDCLIWPSENKTQPTMDHNDVVYVSLRQQQQQQQQQQQCETRTQVQQVRPPAPLEDDATVSDALRGWARYAKQCEQVQQKTDNDSDEDVQKRVLVKEKTGKATKPTKSKSKTNVVKEKDEDVHVADLISQRFLHEYMEQRETEMERDRKKKEARERAAREGRRAAKDRTDIKANKAAQLRAIALADRVEASPFDLWKMEKFTRSARPHVSTFRNGQSASGTSASGAGGAGDGKRGQQHGSRGRYGGGNSGRFSGRSSGGDEEEDFTELVGYCTCPDKLPYYDGSDVYESYHDCADGCLTQDVNFDDGADCVYSYVETTHQSSSPISAL